MEQYRNQNLEQGDISLEFKKEWIEKKIDTECIKFAEEFGRYLARNGLTTSQIRNVFGEIKRIQLGTFEKNKTAFLLLRPKIAYAAKRGNNNGITKFKSFLDAAHNAVNADKEDADNRFSRFCDLIEAILAYHKASGGRD